MKTYTNKDIKPGTFLHKLHKERPVTCFYDKVILIEEFLHNQGYTKEEHLKEMK